MSEVMEQLEKEGKKNLKGDYHLCTSRKFEQGDRIKVLDTTAVEQRYPKTIGMEGVVVFPYYTQNGPFKNYFIRVRLDDGKFASYFAMDLVRVGRWSKW